MPNWCNNSITIQGSTETIKQLWDDAKSDPNGFGLLNAMKPMPKALEGTTAPAPRGDIPQPLIDGATDWYQWRVANWGTKWDIDDDGLEYQDNGDGTSAITGWFDSAWAPPVEAYNSWLDDMDGCSITASYYEPGMDFGGLYEDGSDEFVEGIMEEMRGNQSDLWSPIIRKLDEDYGIAENMDMWEDD